MGSITLADGQHVDYLNCLSGFPSLTSSISISGFSVLVFLRHCIIFPGIAPMYVRLRAQKTKNKETKTDLKILLRIHCTIIAVIYNDENKIATTFALNAVQENFMK